MQFKGFNLDKFQIEAIESLHNGDTVIVSVPTGSGKTLIAEYSINWLLQNTRGKQRLFYTTPIKALSNQKYRDFKREYGEEKIGIMTGDVTVNPTAPIIILTTEIFRNMLYNRADLDDLAFIVFDEMHYFNDIFRGTVWEESLILCPRHVQMILLSATAPNARIFANWLRSLRDEKISVIIDDHRNVPLKNYVYNGKIVSIDRINTKKRKRKKRGKEILHGLDPKTKEFPVIDIALELEDRNMLPALYLIFSKKACEKAALAVASNNNLLNKNEEKEIDKAIHDLSLQLSGDDMQLDQLQDVFYCLKAGVCFHHAGLVPFLKEFIETLFARALIKILYVTETFAVGVNMPAKTVVFHKLTKFDGQKFRRLYAGEFIQLSGRAGRRGIDDVGYIVSVLNPPVKASDIREMIYGKAADLESQFTLSYSSIANHFSTRNEEEILKILEMSFGQYLYQESVNRLFTSKKSRLDSLHRKIDEMAIKCKNGCNNKITGEYKRLELKLAIERGKQFHGKLEPEEVQKYNRNFSDYFERGRLLKLRSNDANPSYVLVIDKMKAKSKNNRLKQLKTMDATGKTVKVSLDDISHGSNILFPGAKQSKWPKKTAKNFLRSITAEVPESSFIPVNKIISEIESSMIDDEKYRKFINRKEKKLRFLEEQLESHSLARCSKIKIHLADFDKSIAYREEIRNINKQMKNIRIIHSRNLKNRIKVMQRFNYLDRDKYLTEKGRFLASIFDDNEILLVESLLKGIFHGLDVDEVAALLGLFVVMSNDDPLTYYPRLDNPRLRKAINRIGGISRSLKDVEKKERVSDKINNKIVFHHGFVQLVYLWSTGVELNELVNETNMSEGNIITNLRRLVDLLQQIGTATRVAPFDVGFDSYWVTERIWRSHVKVEL